jgi:hypothetical protein
MPVLALLVFGAVEWGFTFNDYLVLTSAARSGARIGTADVDAASNPPVVYADDDYEILQAVNTALGSLSSSIVLVSIFNASNQQTVPSGCSGTSAASVMGSCNVYTATEMQNDTETTIDSLYNASSGWPTTDRTVTLSPTAEPTYLGVYILEDHRNLTGFFGASRYISEQAVLRYEPPYEDTRNLGNQTTTSTTSTTTTLPPTTTSTTSTSTTSTTTPGGTTTTAPGGTTTTAAPTTTTVHVTTTTAAPTTTTGGPGTTVAPTTTTIKATTTTTAAPTTTTVKATTTTTSTTSAPTTTTAPPTTTTSTTTPPVSTTEAGHPPG